jgi:predicted transcriptional regulator
MTYTVGQLIANKTPVVVSDTDSVRQALYLMNTNRFSQLPVINNERKVLGIITSESILHALETFGATVNKMHVEDVMDRIRVLDAMDEVKRTFREDDDLFYLLDDLKESNVVLIIDKEQKLISIITSYDTTEYFRARAEDMMYAEEIETMLKEYINAYFTTSEGLDIKARDEAVTAMFPNKTFDSLSQHQYIRLLLHESRWPRYSSVFSFDHETVFNLLDDARKTRNDYAHFHWEEITVGKRERLKFARDWLARHAAIVSSTLTGIVVEPDEVQNMEIQQAETPPSLIEEPDDTSDVTSIGGDNLTEENMRLEKRYEPLAVWLQKVPIKDESISLSFKEIEQIIGDELPESARRSRVWWSNNLKLNPQSRQWWEAGWRVATARMNEEVVVFSRVEGRKKAYIDFFSSLLQQLASRSTFPLRSLSPDGESWIVIASLPSDGPKLATLGFSFARRNRFRVDLYIDRGVESENKRIFNKLLEHRSAIEIELGTSLSWERLEGASASRIALYHQGTITDAEEDLAILQTWAVDAMIRLQNVMEKYLREVI